MNETVRECTAHLNRLSNTTLAAREPIFSAFPPEKSGNVTVVELNTKVLCETKKKLAQ